jgi:cytochrome b561
MPTLVKKYGAVAQLFHWLVVLLLVAQYAVAWTMPDIRRDTLPVGLVAWHLSLGTAILGVMILRAWWRLSHPAPETEGPTLLRRLAVAGHLALYLLLFLVPILGWINASSRGYEVKLLGRIVLPALSPTGSTFGHATGDVHAFFAWVLIVIAVLHVLAALFHHFVLRDGTLKRMMPGGR